MIKTFFFASLLMINLSQVASTPPTEKVIPSTDYSTLWKILIPNDTDSLQRTIHLAAQHGYIITETLPSQTPDATCLVFKVPTEYAPEFDDFRDLLPQLTR